MPRSNFSTLANFNTFGVISCTLVALAGVGALPAVATASAALPTAPQTFDTSYAAPAGATIKVSAGGDLQAALDNAQLGDTIVLQAGATFTGPVKLPNKTTGSGWIYVVSSNLSGLPPAGTRVDPANAPNMPKIVAPSNESALTTVANSNHFRFVGIEFAPASGAAPIYTLIAIGNADASPATLPSYIVFDRCYVHGTPGTNDQRGIEMDGAYVAVVDSYITDFQWVGADTQGLWAYNTSGPLRIFDDYIEAAGENVMFGGADSHAASLVPADIEIRSNYFFKPLSLIGSQWTSKNLLEFKSAQRVLVAGNTFQNNPRAAQNGFAILLTPRNSNGTAPWSITSDIAITGNTVINVGSGFNISGEDNVHQSLPTARVLIRNNLVGVSGLNGADGRAFQFLGGGSDYTIDHNTVINTAGNISDLVMAESTPKVNNFVFTNNLSTHTAYGFFASGLGQGTVALDADFASWTFSRNALTGAPAASYPDGNFFPASVAAIQFVNYTGGNYALSAVSPYKSAATDGTDIGANLSAMPATNQILPDPPANLSVQ